eukprot:GGOE01049210.1.p1 GENE.GGOE01049210.1~~GGOE01049210.1.p1  ORF type:complete len:349 (-),score=106.64 GGOE01049210.1:176-1195(-)
MAAARTALQEMQGGAFIRTASVWRNWIKAGDQRFPPEANRYHLYVSLACPWANRCVATLYMKGLDHVVGLSVVHPTWQRTRPGNSADEHCGWAFRAPTDPPLSSSTGHGSFGCEGCIPDPLNNAQFVRDLYELAGDTGGKYSVPVLWDSKERTIVNNESADIIRMLNSEFNHLARNPDLDLYPEPLRKDIDEINDWVYHGINNGVYRCGFATSQAAYDTAFKELFAALDRCEAILTKQRYLVGNQLTEADLRLFMTLIRFDEVYVVYFKTNRNFISQFPALSNYTRDIFQTPGVKPAINIQHIKTHYFTSHPKLNFYAIIPAGGEAWWEQPHNRSEMLV